MARYAQRLRQAQRLRPREQRPGETLPLVLEVQQKPLTTGLRADYDAVKAGLTLRWSNGLVEGQINRLKMLKRSTFGRAKIDLLSQRFLLAA